MGLLWYKCYFQRPLKEIISASNAFPLLTLPISLISYDLSPKW